MLKLAVMGTGAIAVRRHLPEIRRSEEASLVAVFGHDPAHTKAVAEGFGARYATTDAQRIFRDPDIDAVVVAGVNALHADLTVRALEAGKHVLVEKPMATSVADAVRMVRAAREASRVLMVAQNERLDPAHVRAREILASGRLGRVLVAEAVLAHGGPERWTETAAWFFSARDGVLGALGDLGIHKVDLLRYLLADEVVDVFGRTAILSKRSEVNDNAVLSLRFESGTLATVTASWTAQGREISAERFFCDAGILEVGAGPDRPLLVTWADGHTEEGTSAGVQREPAGAGAGSGVIEAFLESVREGVSRIPGEEGIRSLAVCEAGLVSEGSGARVAVADVIAQTGGF